MNELRLLRSGIASAVWSNMQTRCVRMLDKLPTIRVEPDPLEIEDKPHSQASVSQSMKDYLDRVTKYAKFMSDERTNFAIGKRHLANMMGCDSETFTQEDIDESIRYLFPCGVFERQAWPKMKPPEEIFPVKKEAEFDITGRPYHFLFYTGRPRFYQLLHDAHKILEQLYQLEDRVARGEEPEPKYSKLPLETSSWIDNQKLEREIGEKIHEKEYQKYVAIMDRIAHHKYAQKYEEYIFKSRKFFVSVSTQQVVNGKLESLIDGRQKLTVPGLKKRDTVIDLSLTYPGTGKIQIDNKDIRFFENVTCREMILFPLVLTDMVNKVDIDVDIIRCSTIRAGTKLATQIRFSLSGALAHFVDESSRDKMMLAGLLQRDIRYKERKKSGQWGARRKFSWVKR